MLKSHLYSNLHVIDNPNCSCGHPNETPAHFFLYCPNYIAIRELMINVINQITDVNIHNILYGDSNVSLELNKRIFDSVHRYILNSNRFAS